MQQQDAKTVLLTLGRLPVGLDIARSFAAAGWRVLVAEPWSMHLSRMSNTVSECFRVTSPVVDPERYLDDLEALIAAHDVQLVVPVSEESMHVAALRDRIPAPIEVFCADQERMLALHDKYRFIRMAAEYGLRVPRSSLADAAEAAEVVANVYVSKPRLSCSGRGVVIHRPGEAVPPSPQLLLQEHLDGEHHSSFAIARDGQVLVSSVYRGTVMDGSVAVGFERVADTAVIDAWVAQFVEHSGHTGFIAFDFIVDSAGQAAAIECNPRATSGIHFVARPALAAAILGEPPVSQSLRDEQHLTESYSCFTATLGALFSRRSFRKTLARLRQARDVTWSRSDPWPFLLMMISTWRIIWTALFTRHSFAAAAVLDIEWRAPEGS